MRCAIPAKPQHLINKMNVKSKCQSLLTVSLLLGTVFSTQANAHLMVAQHGTLNFLDDSVYMVLSLPSTAFDAADDDKDGLLSLTEFSTHRTELINIISEHVSLSTKKKKLSIEGLMVSPVTPHDAPKNPANQIIVMGRFVLNDSDAELSFHMGLFGTDEKDQVLEVTASRKSENSQQVFEMSPRKQIMKLDFN